MKKSYLVATTALIFTATCALLINSGNAQESPLYIISGAKIDVTRQPKDIFDKISECGKNLVCNSILTAAEKYFDIYSGEKGSIFKGTAVSNGLAIATWTPVLGLGEGRSWVEAQIEIQGVRTDLLQDKCVTKICQKPDNRILWFCRGKGCINTGDLGQNVRNTAVFELV